MCFKFNKNSQSENRELTGGKTRLETASRIMGGVSDGSLDGRKQSDLLIILRQLRAEAFETSKKLSSLYFKCKVPPAPEDKTCCQIKVEIGAKGNSKSRK